MYLVMPSKITDPPKFGNDTCGSVRFVIIFQQQIKCVVIDTVPCSTKFLREFYSFFIYLFFCFAETIFCDWEFFFLELILQKSRSIRITSFRFLFEYIQSKYR